MKRFLFFLFSKIFSFRIYSFKNVLKCYIFSNWLRPQFSFFGEHSCISSIGTLKGLEFIKIGNNSCFGEQLFLTAWKTEDKKVPSIVVGDFCCFGAFNHITAIDKIIIGNGVLTGKWVTITDNGHGCSSLEDIKIRPILRKLYSKGPVIIEDNVWLGDKVTILPNVTIGKNSIIGANSVVTKDIPPYSIAVGNPAKVIKVIKHE